MNISILIVGVVLFVSGIVLGRQSLPASSKVLNFNKTTTPTVAPTEEVTPTSMTSPEPTENHISASPKPTITSKPTSTTSQPPPSNLSAFRYPGSSQTSQTSTSLTLTSGDSPSSITSWYESKIKELGYTAKSSAKTNTNGNVNNKVAGGKNDGSVSIEIKKGSSESSTTIIVTMGEGNSSDVHIKIENNQTYL